MPQSQSLASVALLAEVHRVNQKRKQDGAKKGTFETQAHLERIPLHATAHLRVVAVEKQAFPVLQPELSLSVWEITMRNLFPGGAVEGKQMQVEVARQIPPLSRIISNEIIHVKALKSTDRSTCTSNDENVMLSKYF